MALTVVCPSCRAPVGRACITSSGAPTDPHAGRLALSVPCPQCPAKAGTLCRNTQGGLNFHPERTYKARGVTGPSFKRELQRQLEQLVALLEQHPEAVSEALLSVTVRGEANLPRLFGDSGGGIVSYQRGALRCYVSLQKQARAPQPPERPTGGRRPCQQEERPRGRRSETPAETAAEMERLPELPVGDEEDGPPLLAAAPAAPGPILLGPSSLPPALPAARTLLALPAPGQQLLFGRGEEP